MNWMEPLLSGGKVSGKIICPNKKCGAKLGNFDWAGMRCGCHEWVTPVSKVNRRCSIRHYLTSKTGILCCQVKSGRDGIGWQFHLDKSHSLVERFLCERFFRLHYMCNDFTGSVCIYAGHFMTSLGGESPVEVCVYVYINVVPLQTCHCGVRNILNQTRTACSHSFHVS